MINEIKKTKGVNAARKAFIENLPNIKENLFTYQYNWGWGQFFSTIDPETHAIGTMIINIKIDPWDRNILHFSAYNRWKPASATRDVPPWSSKTFYPEWQKPWVDAYWYWDEKIGPYE